MSMYWGISAVLAIGMALCAHADTISTWNGGTGNWGTATSWTPAAVPNNSGASAYDVTIGSGGTDTVTLEPLLNPTINSLTIGATAGTAALQYAPVAGSDSLSVVNGLTVNTTGSIFLPGAPGESLSVAGTLTNSGNINVLTGSVSAGNLMNSGQMSLVDESGRSTFSVPGVLTNTGLIQLGEGPNAPGAPITNIGQLVNHGSFNVNSGFVNLATGITDIPAGSGINLSVANFVSGTQSGFSNLTSVEGRLSLYLTASAPNPPAVTVTPQNVSNTLTISPAGVLGIDNGSNWTIAGNLSNAGTIGTGSDERSQGPNALAVRGTLSNTGSMDLEAAQISAQTLANGGSITLRGADRFSSGSELTVGTGAAKLGYTQYGDGTLDELIFGPSTYGTIALNGPVSLAGTLEIMLEDGFTPTPGESFTILTFIPGELAGAFNRLLGDSLFTVSYGPGTVTVTAEAVPEPGTFFMTGCVLMGVVVFRRTVRRLKPAPPVLMACRSLGGCL